jgi:hypothetical protein
MKNKSIQKDACDILRKLVEDANIHRMLHGTRNAKPGEFIERLGPVKKMVLSHLKSDSIKNDRWPK